MAGLGAISDEEVNRSMTGNYQDIITLSVDRNEDDNAVLVEGTEVDNEGSDVFSLGALGKV